MKPTLTAPAVGSSPWPFSPGCLVTVLAFPHWSLLPNGHLKIQTWSSVKSAWAPEARLPSLAGCTSHSPVLWACPHGQEGSAPSRSCCGYLDTGLWWSIPQGVCSPSPPGVSGICNLHLLSPVVLVPTPNLEAGRESWVLRYLVAASVPPYRSQRG